MWLLYADETNLEERTGDFFTYAGLAVDADKALSLSQAVTALLAKGVISRDYKLKFNTHPENLNRNESNALKQAAIKLAIEHDCRFLANIVLHDIAKTPDEARLYGINTICFHFDCLLTRLETSGLVLIDRFSDKQIDAHLAEKFCTGVTGLPYTEEKPLRNVVGFHYSAIGQGHFPSLIDVVIGSLRFSINAFTRNDENNLAAARKLLRLIAPLFHRDDPQRPIPEISFSFSPKNIKSMTFLDQYRKLQAFLSENGVDTAQRIDGQA